MDEAEDAGTRDWVPVTVLVRSILAVVAVACAATGCPAKTVHEKPVAVPSAAAPSAALGVQEYRPGLGITPPVAIRRAHPDLGSLSRRTMHGGILVFAAVITSEGKVGEVRILKAYDPELDELSLAAFKRWRFRPASKDGKDVPVVMTFTVTPEFF